MTATNPTARARSPWIPGGPVIIAFVVGMIVGPMVTGYAGLTVSSRAAGSRLHADTIELKASLCEARARLSNPQAGTLDDAQRRELATKFAQTQSSGEVDYEIVNLCSNKLGA